MAFCRILFKAVLAALFFSGLPRPALSAAETPPGQQLAGGRVCFSAFVNSSFRRRQKLTAWKTTALAIRRTLEIWYPEHLTCSFVENGPPETFRQFLHGLPAGKDCGISLVYLCSHQSPAGEWDFPEEKLLPLDTLLGDAGIRENSRRIVILDTCFAAAAGNQSLWRKLAPLSLFASQATEETPEANFHSPQPVDYAHRYPAAYTWLKTTLGREWDGKISFLGFVWVQTFLQQKKAPHDIPGWLDFMEQCQATAAQFRQQVSKKSSSQITVTLKAGDKELSGK